MITKNIIEMIKDDEDFYDEDFTDYFSTLFLKIMIAICLPISLIIDIVSSPLQIIAYKLWKRKVKKDER